MRKQPFFLSRFTKLLMAFVLVGLIPMLITGQVMYQRLTDNVEQIVSANASQIVCNFGLNVENTIDNYNQIGSAMYDYSSDDYVFLADLLKDEQITDLEKESEVNAMLSSILYANSYIRNVRFVTSDEDVYNVSRDKTSIVNRKLVCENQWEYDAKNIRDCCMLSQKSETAYYYNTDDAIVTLARNYMDVSTVKTALSTALGTLYIDVDPGQFAILEKGIGLGNHSTLGIYDLQDGYCIYNTDRDKIDQTDQTLYEKLQSFSGDYGTFRSSEGMYAYYKIENTSWEAVARLDQTDINASYVENSRYFISILLLSSILLSIIYYFLSQKINRPTRILKAGMEQMKNGNLDVRVSVNTHDEMELLGEGFNEMADNLQKYIGQVYVAELRQKDAELEALKSTIKPHYLYNTLEVIRMTALTNQDQLVADMLESLSKQLQYLIGKQREMVTLREEIQNIQDYFYIVQIRFENRFELEVNVENGCMELYVLKLILQPIVENAVNHGLRPKTGQGKISISAQKKENYLELTVMDDGVGMSEEKRLELEQKMNRVLEDDEQKDESCKDSSCRKYSIGLKNVFDRIRINYGEEFGFQIISMEGLGTIVKYKLPIVSDERLIR